MRRSHPPTLLTLLERALRQECGVEPGDRILVAVSGGGDSQALLHGLARLAPKLRFQVMAHGVDHGLRAEASAELRLARDTCESLGVPFSQSRVRVDPGGNLLARARARRYTALRAAQLETGAHFLATAHHADDRAETVLLRLLRGVSPTGLGVLPPRSEDLLRPMIRARRADVLAHLRRHALPFASDPSNENRRYLRVRVRLELLPLLAQLSPRIVEHLTALADAAAEQSPVVLVDGQGDSMTLSRAQRTALARLLGRRAPGASVTLTGGRQVRLAADGTLRVGVPPAPGLPGARKVIKG